MAADILDMALHRTHGKLSWQCITSCQCEILWLQLIDGRQWLLKVDILKAASAHKQRSEVLFTFLLCCCDRPNVQGHPDGCQRLLLRLRAYPVRAHQLLFTSS